MPSHMVTPCVDISISPKIARKFGGGLLIYNVRIAHLLSLVITSFPTLFVR
jgi:hypothetical protein